MNDNSIQQLSQNFFLIPCPLLVCYSSVITHIGLFPFFTFIILFPLSKEDKQKRRDLTGFDGYLCTWHGVMWFYIVYPFILQNNSVKKILSIQVLEMFFKITQTLVEPNSKSMSHLYSIVTCDLIDFFLFWLKKCVPEVVSFAHLVCDVCPHVLSLHANGSKKGIWCQASQNSQLTPLSPFLSFFPLFFSLLF